MQILQVKEYNRLDLAKYYKRVEEWKNDRYNNNIIPQIAFVGFRKKNGDFKNDGFVAFGENHAHLFKTKQEAKRFIEQEEEIK